MTDGFLSHETHGIFLKPHPSDAAMVTLLAAARAMPRQIAALVSHSVKEGDVAGSQETVKMT
jgi:hypothetical protein